MYSVLLQRRIKLYLFQEIDREFQEISQGIPSILKFGDSLLIALQVRVRLPQVVNRCLGSSAARASAWIAGLSHELYPYDQWQGWHLPPRVVISNWPNFETRCHEAYVPSAALVGDINLDSVCILEALVAFQSIKAVPGTLLLASYTRLHK
jgi:hypothetical protein